MLVMPCARACVCVYKYVIRRIAVIVHPGPFDARAHAHLYTDTGTSRCR